MSSIQKEHGAADLLDEPYLPPDDLAVGDTNRFLRRLGPRARIGLCQLPLTAIILGVALAAPGVWPGLLGVPLFEASLVLHAVLFICCWVVPWERLPQSAPLLIPLGDIVAIALSRNSGNEVLPGLGILLIFPVIWLSASGIFPWAAVLISFLAPLATIGIPLIGQPPEVAAAQFSGLVFLPAMLLAVALVLRFVTANAAQQQRELLRKDATLRRLLRSSNERERLLNTILDTIDVGVVAVDADGDTMLSNHQQRVFHKLSSPPGTPKAKEPDLLLFGADRRTPVPASRRPVRRAIDGETFADHLVWAGVGPGQRALSTAARAMTTDAGEFGGAVVATSDVTGLVEAISAKDELIANVSHELRTPLTSILGNLELVLDEEDRIPPDTASYLNIAHTNAERLLELVSDLLLSASAAMSVHPRRTDLAGLVGSSVGTALPHAEAAGLTIRTDVPAPLWTHADPLRISQVLDNLLSNAIKYSTTGGTITVTARPQGSEVKLCVEDTGIGMSAADAAKAFDKFFRTQSVRESAIPGTGLGLSITKAIVEGHGGTITCASAPGGGTSFTVTLPAEPAR